MTVLEYWQYIDDVIYVVLGVLLFFAVSIFAMLFKMGDASHRATHHSTDANPFLDEK